MKLSYTNLIFFFQMNKFNSRHILNFFSQRNGSLSLARLLRNKSCYYSPRFYFSNQQKNDQSHSDSDPKVEILDEEEQIQSRYMKKQTFLERNKLTLGLALSGVGLFFFNYGLVGSTFVLASLISLWRAESLGLKLKALKEDVHGQHNTMHTNLNQLLARTLLEEEKLKKFITKEGLCFSDMQLTRVVTHGQRKVFKPIDNYESMQKKYRYVVRFFDVTTGADGWIASECIYNYDKDYYFRVIWLDLYKPMHLKLTIVDNRDTVDTESYESASKSKSDSDSQ